MEFSPIIPLLRTISINMEHNNRFSRDTLFSKTTPPQRTQSTPGMRFLSKSPVNTRTTLESRTFLINNTFLRIINNWLRVVYLPAASPSASRQLVKGLRLKSANIGCLRPFFTSHEPCTNFTRAPRQYNNFFIQ